MPTARASVAARKLVPSAAESAIASGTGRIRLSKALAAKPAGKFARMATPTTLPKPDVAKPKKFKCVSERYKIPGDEYAQLIALKKRLLLLGVGTKKSELLRAGLMLLVAMDDVQLTKAIARRKIVKAARALKPAD